MKKPIYSIWDSVAEFYSPIFLAENDNHATRMMTQSISLEHKADFTLMKVGQFDTESGVIDETIPQLVIAGLSIGEPTQ